MSINGRPSDKPWCPDCAECGGEGLTSRYLWHRFRGRDVMSSVACYCHRCLAGRWVEERHRLNNPDIRRRIFDLQEPRFAALLPDELRYAPSMRDATATYAPPSARSPPSRASPALEPTQATPATSRADRVFDDFFPDDEGAFS